MLAYCATLSRRRLRAKAGQRARVSLRSAACAQQHRDQAHSRHAHTDEQVIAHTPAS